MDLEKLENLPKREGMYSKKLNHWERNYRCVKIDGASIYKFTNRVIENYIGKSFDDAFSYFCKKVPKYLQYIFLNELDPCYKRWNRFTEFILDENKTIIQNPEYLNWHKEYNKSAPVMFYSYDYKTAYMHRGTKEIISKSEYLNRYWYSKNYIEIIISGYEREFPSKQDKTYKRLMKEKVRLKKLQKQRYKKYLKQKAYSFMTRDEVKKKKEQQEDIIKRDALGFNDESFKGEWYHGQKRKLKQVA